jgi:uncharacterized protein YidB (DUF937 family)
MGLLDDMLGSALPGGKISKPLMLALLALLASGTLFGGGDREAAPTQPTGPRPPADEGGGLLDGLGGLLDRFRQSGQGKTADSWDRAERTGISGAGRQCSRAEHSQDACRAIRLVGGGTAEAVVASSSWCGG